jgi:transcriptional regulator with XRE-family HTH domain
MDTEKWFNDKLAALKNDADFRLETIIIDLTEQISARMKEKGMTRVKLANVLGVTPAAVSKLLNGNPNFTLKTLLKVANALQLEFNVSLGAKIATSKPALISPFREAQQKQSISIPTVDAYAYPEKEPPKFPCPPEPFYWNSDDSTTGPRYGGSFS